MPSRTSDDRLLTANAKTIARAIRRVAEVAGSPAEFRIEGARGLVLHVLPSGTATWYLHYDVRQGRRRLRRKYKIGRSDEVALAAAIQRAERLRTDVRAGADPAAERTATSEAMTIAELAEARLTSGPQLRASSERDFRDLLRRDILPVIGVPVKSNALNGLDSLLSIVQMPRGVPVATVAIGNATNAGLLAVRILALTDPTLAAKLVAYAERQAREAVEG